MTIRDTRYVNEDGSVVLRKEIARDVVTPDPEKIAALYVKPEDNK